MQMDEAKINPMSKHKKIHEFKLLIKLLTTYTHSLLYYSKKKKDWHISKMQECDNKIHIHYIYIQKKAVDYTLPVKCIVVGRTLL